MLKASEILAPVGKVPSKLRDRGLVEMVKSGFAMWNPNAREIMRLPLGEMLDHRLESLLIDALASWLPQRVACPVPEGALAVAVRHIKKASRLPCLFVERRGDVLEFQGYDLDEEQGSSVALSVLRSIGGFLAEMGLSTRRWDETVGRGGRCRIVSHGDNGDMGTVAGLRCLCGWTGSESSPVEFGGFSEKGEFPMERVYTPGAGSIEDLCRYLSVNPGETVKTMCFSDGEGRGVIALVRGDRSVSQGKLSRVAGRDLHPSSEDELCRLLGDLAGFLGPIGLPAGVEVWADRSVEGIPWSVVGANERDHHLVGARWGRDFSATVADIAAMEAGDRCPLCGGSLEDASLIPLASLELWNDVADMEPSLTYMDEDRRKRRPFCWVMKIHMTALEGAFFRQERLPEPISPVSTILRPSPGCQGLAVSLASKLESMGIDVLLDDGEPYCFSLDGKVVFPWDVLVSGDSLEIRGPDGKADRISKNIGHRGIQKNDE